MSNKNREDIKFRIQEDFIPFSGLTRYRERNEDNPAKEEFSYILRDASLTAFNLIPIALGVVASYYLIDNLVKLITK